MQCGIQDVMSALRPRRPERVGDRVEPRDHGRELHRRRRQLDLHRERRGGLGRAVVGRRPAGRSRRAPRTLAVVTAAVGSANVTVPGPEHLAPGRRAGGGPGGCAAAARAGRRVDAAFPARRLRRSRPTRSGTSCRAASRRGRGRRRRCRSAGAACADSRSVARTREFDVRRRHHRHRAGPPGRQEFAPSQGSRPCLAHEVTSLGGCWREPGC